MQTWALLLHLDLPTVRPATEGLVDTSLGRMRNAVIRGLDAGHPPGPGTNAVLPILLGVVGGARWCAIGGALGHVHVPLQPPAAHRAPVVPADHARPRRCRCAFRAARSVDAVFDVAGDTTLWARNDERKRRVHVNGAQHVVEAALERRAG